MAGVQEVSIGMYEWSTIKDSVDSTGMVSIRTEGDVGIGISFISMI